MPSLECPDEFRHEPNALWQMRLIGPLMSASEGYKRIAKDYNQDFAAGNYDAPRLVSEAVCRMYPEDGPIARADLKIMDVAAGTGLVGQRLYDAGFRQLDALDPSAEMLSVAKERGIYQTIIQDTIGTHRINVEDNTYDAVTIAGGFVQGHCPLTAYDEMIRICKPGGYIMNSMRYEYLVTVPEYHGMHNHMDQLEQRGLWRRIDRYVTDKYFFNTKQGITYIYQKM